MYVNGPNTNTRSAPSRLLSGGRTVKLKAVDPDAGLGTQRGGGGAFRNSTLLHKGFYDLLNLLRPEPARPFSGVQADNPSPERTPVRYPLSAEQMMRPPISPALHASHSMPGYLPSSGLDTVSPLRNNFPKMDSDSKKKTRRISKDMISSPMNPVHVVHASDADQAHELLMSWSVEGIGKVPDENWAKTMKGLIQSRAKERQAIAIAQVQAALHPSNAENTPLQVVNGMPSSIYASTITPSADPPFSPASYFTINTIVTAGHPDLLSSNSITITGRTPLASPCYDILEGPILERPTLERPSTFNEIVPGILSEAARRPLYVPPSPRIDGLQDIRESCEISTLPPRVSIWKPALPPRPVVPTMETLEKSAAAAIFFETLYHGMLKSATSHQNVHLGREKRRLALETQLEGYSTAKKILAREQLRYEETAWLREKRKKVGVKNFTRLKIIGHGAFGVVSLVKERDSEALYAMKQLRKADMLRKGQEGHVRSERDLLAAAASNGSADGSYIVKLHYSFQDADHLYLILDYEGGGDLLNLLVEKDIFPEDFTKFYIAEMVLCLEACHKLGYIHRDIKPDNFLISPEGHLKISDFGLATDLHWAHDTNYYEAQRHDLLKRHGIDLEEPNPATLTRRLDRKSAEKLMGGKEGLLTWRDKNRKKLAYSVAGTNSYMAPEVIRGLGYGYSCDWWSLGIIMYECLYGYPPFVSQSRQQTRQKILNWSSNLKFPSRPRVSREAIDLLQALLCEPIDRIGSTLENSRLNVQPERKSGFLQPPTGGLPMDDGASELKSHPWFKGIDFKNLHNMEAPYQPNLANPSDTSHFDDDIPDEPLAPAGGAPGAATKDPILKHHVHGAPMLAVRKKNAFVGFTYKGPRNLSSHPRSDSLFEPEPESMPFPGSNHTELREEEHFASLSTPRTRALSF